MKRVLVVSDLHVGSTVSVMPSEVQIEHRDHTRANMVQANPLQKILLEKWEEMIETAGKVDGCFVLGDCVDGPNVKSRGFELWTSNLHQQVSTAADLLAMIRTNHYFGVQGSFYHTGENTSSDLAVIDTLKGTFGTDLAVNVEGQRVHLCHQISYSSSPMTRATASNGEIIGAALYDKWFGQFSLLLRGHLHRYLHLHDPNGRIALCPGWKVRDSFVAKQGLKGGPSHIGYLLLHVDGENIFIEPHCYVPHFEHFFKEAAV